MLGGRGRGAGDSAGAADQAALSSQMRERVAYFRHPPAGGAAAVENNPLGESQCSQVRCANPVERGSARFTPKTEFFVENFFSQYDMYLEY